MIGFLTSRSLPVTIVAPAIRRRVAQLFPLLILTVCALGTGLAGAVGLGEIEIRSKIGSPLRAVIPMHVGPGETLSGYCVNTAGSQIGQKGPRNLKVIGPAAASPGTYPVHISTPNPLTEPLYEFSVVVDCPNIPVVVRHYTVMLALPGQTPDPAASQTAVAATTDKTDTGLVVATDAESVTDSSTVEIEEPAVEEPAVEASPENGDAVEPVPETKNANQSDPEPAEAQVKRPIKPGTDYQVRNADSLLSIVQRITGRKPATVWQIAEQIFRTNPHAFAGGDANLIKSGAQLQIPDADTLAALSNSEAAARAALIKKTAPPVTVTTPEAPPVEAVAAGPVAAITTDSATDNPASTEASRPALPTEAMVTETPPAPTAKTEPLPNETGLSAPTQATLPVLGSESPSSLDITTEPDLKTADNTLLSTAPEAGPVAAPNEEAPPEAAMPVAVLAAITGSLAGYALPADNETTSTLIAVGVGTGLGLLLSLMIFRGRLIAGVAALFHRKQRSRAPVAVQRAVTEPEPSTDDAPSELTDFVDTLAGEAFETKAEYPQSAGILEIGELLQRESPEAAHEETMLKQTTDTVALDPKEVVTMDVGSVIQDEIPVDDDLTGLFAEDQQYSEVFDPTASITSDDKLSAQSFDPTAEVPGIPFAESSAELPGDEVIDPTGELPVVDMLEPSEQFSATPTMVIDEQDAQADEIDISDSMLTQALSEDLDSMEPGEMFSSSENELQASMEEDEHLLTSELTETGLRAIPENFGESAISALDDPLSMLEAEYEDEFTSSQILEQTVIKKALADTDSSDSDSDSEDAGAERNKTTAA